MFDTWSKNNEKKKGLADLCMMVYPGSFMSDFLSSYSNNLQHNRGSALRMMHYGKVQGTQTRENI